MIVDCSSDKVARRLYSVVRADTGECLDHMAIWYADDEAGIIRCYLRDEAGKHYMNEAGDHAAWEERQEAIKIVPKSAEQLAAYDALRVAYDALKVSCA